MHIHLDTLPENGDMDGGEARGCCSTQRDVASAGSKQAKLNLWLILKNTPECVGATVEKHDLDMPPLHT